MCGVRWDGVCGVRVWREECEVGWSVWDVRGKCVV